MQILFLLFPYILSLEYYDNILSCTSQNLTSNPQIPLCICTYKCLTKTQCVKINSHCTCPITSNEGYECMYSFIKHEESSCYGVSEFDVDVCGGNGQCINGYCKCNEWYYNDGTECEMMVLTALISSLIENSVALMVFGIVILICGAVLFLYYFYLSQPISSVIGQVNNERKEVDELLTEFIFIKNVFLSHSVIKSKMLKLMVRKRTKELAIKSGDRRKISEFIERHVLDDDVINSNPGLEKVLKEYYDSVSSDMKRKSDIVNAFKVLENIIFYKKIEKPLIVSFIINLYFKVLDYMVLDYDDYKELPKKYFKYFQNLNIIIKRAENKCNSFHKLHSDEFKKNMKLFNEYKKSIKYANAKEYQPIIENYKTTMKMSNITKNVKELKKYHEINKEIKVKESNEEDEQDKIIIHCSNLQESEKENHLMNLIELENDAKRKVKTIKEFRIETEQLCAEELLDKIHRYVKENSDSDVKYYCNELLDFLKEKFFVVDTPYSLLDKVMSIVELIIETNENNFDKVVMPILDCALKIMNISLYYQKITDESLNESKRDDFFHLLSIFQEKFKNNYLISHKIKSINENLKLIKDASSLTEQILSSIKLFDYSDLLLLLRTKLKQITQPTSILNPESWYKTSLAYILKEESMILELERVNLQHYFKHNIDVKLHLLEIIEKNCVELFERHLRIKTLFKKMRKDYPDLVSKKTFSFISDLEPSVNIKYIQEIKFTKIEDCDDDRIIQEEERMKDGHEDVIVIIDEKDEGKNLKSPITLEDDELSDFIQYFLCLKRYDKKDSIFSNKRKVYPNNYELINNSTSEEVFLNFLINENFFTLLKFRKLWNIIQSICRLVDDPYIQTICIKVNSTIINKIGQKSTNYSAMEKRTKRIKNKEVRKYLFDEIEKSILSANKWFTYEKFINDICVNITFLELEISLMSKPLSSFQTFDNRELTVDQLLDELDDEENILFKGSGGSGKSCLLRFLCWNYGKQKTSFPIFVKADVITNFSKEWVKCSMERKVDILVETIITSQYSELNTHFTSTQITELTFELKAICKNESLILVVDGFDEVSDIQKNVFCEFLKYLVKESDVEISKIFLSSRFIKEIETGFFKKEFTHYTINPLSYDSSRKLVENILVHQGFNKEVILPRFEKVRKKLMEQNPLISVLILKRLLNTEKKDDDDISNRSKLYTGILYSSLTEDKHRKKHSDTSVANCSNVFLMNLLSIISYILHRTQDQTKNNIVNILNQHLEIVCDTEKWLMSVKNPLESVIESLISFTSLCSQQKDFVIFSHRTIQEFFCARFIVNVDNNQNMNKLLKYFNGNDNLYFSFYFEVKMEGGEARNHWSNVYEFYNLFLFDPFENIDNLIFYRILLSYYLNKIKYPSDSAYFFDELRKKICFSSVFEKERNQMNRSNNGFLKRFSKLCNAEFKKIEENIHFDDYKEELIQLLSLRKFGKYYDGKFQRFQSLLDCFKDIRMLLLNFPKFFGLSFQLNNSVRELFTKHNIHQNSSIMNYLEFSLRTIDLADEESIMIKEKREFFQKILNLLYIEINDEIDSFFNFDKILSDMLSKISLNHKKDVLNLFLYHLLFTNYDFQKTREFFQKHHLFLDFDQNYIKEKLVFNVNGNYNVMSVSQILQKIEIYSNCSFFEISMNDINEISERKELTSSIVWESVDYTLFESDTHSVRREILTKLKNLSENHPVCLPKDNAGLVKIISNHKRDYFAYCFKDKVIFPSKNRIISFKTSKGDEYSLWKDHIYYFNDSDDIFLICTNEKVSEKNYLFVRDIPVTIYFCVITNEKNFKFSTQNYDNVLDDKFFFYQPKNMLFVCEEHFLFCLERTSNSLIQVKKQSLFTYSECYDHSSIICKIHYPNCYDPIIILQDINNNFVFYNFVSKTVVFNYHISGFSIEEKIQFFYFESSKSFYYKYFKKGRTYLKLISILKKPEKDIRCTKIDFDNSEFNDLCVKNPYYYFFIRKTDNFNVFKNTLFKAEFTEDQINSQLESLKSILIHNQKSLEDLLKNKAKEDQSTSEGNKTGIKDVSKETCSDICGRIITKKSQSIGETKHYEYRSLKNKDFSYLLYEDETQTQIIMYEKDGTVKYTGTMESYEKNRNNNTSHKKEEEKFFSMLEDLIFFSEEKASKIENFWGKECTFKDLEKKSDEPIYYLGHVLKGKKVYFKEDESKVKFSFLEGNFTKEVDESKADKFSYFWNGTGIEYNLAGEKVYEGTFGNYGAYKKGTVYHKSKILFQGTFEFSNNEISILKNARQSFDKQTVHRAIGIMYKDGKMFIDGVFKYFNTFFTVFGCKEVPFTKLLDSFYRSSDFVFSEEGGHYFIPIHGKVFNVDTRVMFYNGEIMSNTCVNGEFYDMETREFIYKDNMIYLYEQDMKEIRRRDGVLSFVYSLDAKRYDFYILKSIFFNDPSFRSNIKSYIHKDHHFLVKKRRRINDIKLRICYFYFKEFSKIYIGTIEDKKNTIIFKEGIFFHYLGRKIEKTDRKRITIFDKNTLELIYTGGFNTEKSEMQGIGQYRFINSSGDKVIYKGDFLENKFDGYGKIILERLNKVIFKGQFKDGKYNGKGIIFDEFGQKQFDGRFRKGKKVGKCEEFDQTQKVFVKKNYYNGDILHGMKVFFIDEPSKIKYEFIKGGFLKYNLFKGLMKEYNKSQTLIFEGTTDQKGRYKEGKLFNGVDEFPMYVGSFNKNGEYHGEGEIYNPSLEKLIFKGKLKDGGYEHGHLFSKLTHKLLYLGGFDQNQEYDKSGELYDEETGHLVYSGGWKHGKTYLIGKHYDRNTGKYKYKREIFADDYYTGKAICSEKDVKDEDMFCVNDRVEAIDKLNPTLICCATIVAVMDDEMKVHFDGWTNKYDYKIKMNECEKFIFPIGYCKEHNIQLQLPRGYGKPFVWDEYLKEEKTRTPPKSAWRKTYISDQKVAFKEGYFSVGMKVEAIDKANPSLICVASITKIEGTKMEIHFDGWTDIYNYMIDMNNCSDFVFPIGYCKNVSHVLQKPNKYPKDFTWENYLKETKTIAAGVECWEKSYEIEESVSSGVWSNMGFKALFEKNDKVEAIDKNYLHMICVATIIEVNVDKIKVRFDNWGEGYDFWEKKETYKNFVYPVGYATKNGKKITKPHGYSKEFNWDVYLKETNSKAAPDSSFI